MSVYVFLLIWELHCILRKHSEVVSCYIFNDFECRQLKRATLNNVSDLNLDLTLNKTLFSLVFFFKCGHFVTHMVKKHRKQYRIVISKLYNLHVCIYSNFQASKDTEKVLSTDFWLLNMVCHENIGNHISLRANNLFGP